MPYASGGYFGGGPGGPSGAATETLPATAIAIPTPTATPARYSSADLVAMCKEKAGRPTVDAQMDDAAWYRLLTEAQDALVGEIAARVPSALAHQYATLDTDDGGATFTFGRDVYGELAFPMGHVEVWARESGGRVLFAASYENKGGDFVIEPKRIRTPGNSARTYADGPYARWVGVPAAITASVQPIIQPRPMRVLLVYYALMLWAERGQRRDPAPWAMAFRREWLGEPNGTGQLGWAGQLQLRFTTNMVPASGRQDMAWWQAADWGGR